MAHDQERKATELALTWVPCGTCWGQRKIVSLGPDESVCEEVCPSCLGVGERLQGAPPRI